jgi:hypothetical protein
MISTDHYRAVFNAAVNLTLQEVFTIAKRFDPQGLRTVGVMTHCDAVQKTAETQVRLVNLLGFPN